MAKSVITFLMFEGKAEEAMNVYVSLFDDARIVELNHHGSDVPGGEGMVLRGVFELNGTSFMCFDSPMHHEFTFTPAMSLFVECQSEEELDRLFGQLSQGGEVRMEPGAYGFSQKFGWTDDRFGVSWQLNLA